MNLSMRLFKAEIVEILSHKSCRYISLLSYTRSTITQHTSMMRQKRTGVSIIS